MLLCSLVQLAVLSLGYKVLMTTVPGSSGSGQACRPLRRLPVVVILAHGPVESALVLRA